MTLTRATVPRRVVALEAERTAAALARLRAAWAAIEARPPPSPAEVARLRAKHDAWTPAERATTERQVAALDLLLNPATPAATITRVAASLAPGAGEPTWAILDALAAHFVTIAGAAETR